MTLADQIEQAKRADQIRAWDKGERELAATIAAPDIELSTDLRSRLGPFFEFAEAKSVRRLPARPVSVACWVRFQAGLGVPADQILAALLAIEAAHDRHCLANPVATAIVRAEVEKFAKVEAPRSWPKAEKAMFVLLPPDIRHIIALRQEQQDREIRKLQSKVARQLEELRSSNNTETKLVHSNEKEATHETQI